MTTLPMTDKASHAPSASPITSPYAAMFTELAPGYDPRHIEAYIRLEYSTLSHLSRATLRREVAIAKACIDEGGKEEAEQCARSFGL